MALTFLTGGARSGKSSLATRLALAAGTDTFFVATARAYDEDMRARIARHRADRPPSWQTIEEPVELGATIEWIPPSATLVVDCLTLWTSNLMLEGLDEPAIVERAQGAAALGAARPGATFVVTNEVGSGVHPATDLGRHFQDVLGRVNAVWGEASHRALLVVAGRVLPLERLET